MKIIYDPYRTPGVGTLMRVGDVDQNAVMDGVCFARGIPAAAIGGLINYWFWGWIGVRETPRRILTGLGVLGSLLNCNVRK